MRMLFVWTGVSRYMGDCWRALQAQPGVELKVAVDPLSDRQTDYRPERELADLDYCLARRGDEVRLGAWRPDVIFLVGWHSPLCRHFAEASDHASVPKVCCLDMPWRWKVRCLVAPLFLRRYARRFAAAYVPGESSRRYAAWIGFRDIHTGVYAIDQSRFRRGGAASVPSAAPFVYLGRYSPEKRLDVLLAGYRRYREQGGTRPLHLYGKGEALPRTAASVSGVTVHGFLAPTAVPEVLHGAAALVLTSAFDPWPLVLLEAMSAGCRVIASDRCTNAPELGADWGRFPSGDAAALAAEMLRVETLRVAEPSVVAPYDTSAWAARTLALAHGVRA